MLLLLDCLDVVSKHSLYNFKKIFSYDVHSFLYTYIILLHIGILSAADEGAIDEEELTRRVEDAHNWRTVPVPIIYRPNYYYIALPALPFILTWYFFGNQLRNVKPKTEYQLEHLVVEKSYFGPQVLFFMYFSIVVLLIFYRWNEEDVWHWQPERQWRSYAYIYRINQQSADLFICLFVIWYPIYYITYTLVEHPHTGYLFYFILFFWAPFYSYYSYMPEEFEIVSPQIQPTGRVLDWVKLHRIREKYRIWTEEFFVYNQENDTFKLRKGRALKDWWAQMFLEEDNFDAFYDGGDLLTWQRYVILLVITIPIAFLMLYFS